MVLLSRLAFWLMLPVTAVQGLWLRRRATRLPGAMGDRRGVSGEGADFHLLALGDSIIDGVGNSPCRFSSLPRWPRRRAGAWCGTWTAPPAGISRTCSIA
jgi:hypothetical protein